MNKIIEECKTRYRIQKYIKLLLIMGTAIGALCSITRGGWLNAAILLLACILSIDGYSATADAEEWMEIADSSVRAMEEVSGKQR